MKVAFETLGCRLNQFETDALAAQFVKAGWEIAESEQTADVCVVNTCTVTNKSDRKSRNTVNRLARIEKDPVVVVTGCFAEGAKNQLEAQPGVTFVVPNDRKNTIYSLVEAYFKGELSGPDLPEPDVFGYPSLPRFFHTRASVKIQDGCDNFCSFCIIPFVRGRAKSRPLTAIVEEVAKLLASGVKEIVLTGVNIGRYRWEDADFSLLLKTLLDIPGNWRLRISSLEPDGLGERFLDLLQHPRMTPHLHLCLQSGSERVLLSMRREYSRQEFLNLVAAIRDRIPGFQITTDVIVGFPGESQQEFEETRRTLKNVGFLQVHIFKFSRRDGTRAERLSGQLSEVQKSERSRILHEDAKAIKMETLISWVGRRQEVLVERVVDGWAQGFGQHYLPVRFRDSEAQRNTFVQVHLDELSRDESGDPCLLGHRLGSEFSLENSGKLF